jgi:outer membrane receptor protein involved in Fe transport
MALQGLLDTTSRLAVEKSMHYSYGIYQKITDKTDVRLSGYYHNIHDYAVVDRGRGIFENKFMFNLDRVNVYGVEIELTQNFIYGIGGFANYTYQGWNKEDLQGVQPFLLKVIPKHKFNIGLRYQATEELMLLGDLRYKSTRQRKFSQDHLATGVVFDVSPGPQPSYAVFDLGAEYSFHKNKGKLTAYMDNVFGTNYQETFGFPMPRQNWGLRLSYAY